VNGWAHVDVTPAIGSVTATFTSTRAFLSCFEYRTDGNVPDQKLNANGGNNYNTLVLDGLWPYTCKNNSSSSLNIPATGYVEIRNEPY
jgi:hypothetical protein